MTEFLTLHKYDFTSDDSYLIRGRVKCGQFDLVKYMLTLPGVNTRHHSEMALPWAISESRLRIVEFLLYVPGINPLVDDNYIITAALYENNIEIWKILFTHPEIKKYLKIHIFSILEKLRKHKYKKAERFFLEQFISYNIQL